ncbi:MAG: hypothetical protein QXO25_04610 [Candidatus Bathyarchaeia archaeon]
MVFVKNYEIWGMNADGSNQQKLTSPTGDLKDDELNWSPDGTKIVFERIPDSIWIMNADGSGAHDLTPSKPNARDPDYQMIQSRPVGGLVIPANKLEILAPYLALAGLVAAVSAVVAVRRRREA